MSTTTPNGAPSPRTSPPARRPSRQAPRNGTSPTPTGAPSNDTGGGVAAQPAPFRPQRRARNFVAAIVLAGMGALGVYFAVDSATNTTPVVEVQASVARGETITRDDLTTVEVSAPGVKTGPATQLEDRSGQRAQQPLYPGTLLTPDALTANVVPATGQSLVGIALSTAQMPTEPLATGDTVSIIDTPNNSDAGGQVSDSPNATTATVQNVGPTDPQGMTTVDVLVPETAAARLAAQASTGRVALVLQSRER